MSTVFLSPVHGVNNKQNSKRHFILRVSLCENTFSLLLDYNLRLQFLINQIDFFGIAGGHLVSN